MQSEMQGVAQNEKQNEKKKMHAGVKVLIVVLAVLVVLVGGAAGFFLLGGPEWLAMRGPAAQPYFAEGEVRAVRLAPPKDDLSEEGMRAYFEEAAAGAKENGFNTVVFQGRDGMVAYWRDGNFPAPNAVVEQDSFLGLTKVDPLALLLEATEAQGLQVWLEIDPYAAVQTAPNLAGRVADLAAERGSGLVQFSPDDEEYNKLLLKSLARLPHMYGVAAVVLGGDGAVLSAGEVTGAEGVRPAFEETVKGIEDAWAEKGYETRLALAFSPGTGLVDASYATALVADGVEYLLPELAAGYGTAAKLASYGGTGAQVIAVQPEGDDDTLLFTAASTPGYAGALLGSWPQVAQDKTALALLVSTLSPPAAGDVQLPAGFDIPQTLQINYPLPGNAISSVQEKVFIMGNSNPALPLTMNGAEVPRYGADGVFGIEVALVTGDNTFVFQQGDITVTHVINRPAPSGGSGAAGPRPDDNTREVPEGTAVRVAGVFAGALTDPGNDGAMNETFYGGAVAVVRGCVQTVRYNSSWGRNVNTWAYLLASGDYLLAQNCNVIEGDGRSAFTGLSAQEDERGEWITFEGAGTPAAYIADENGTISITMFDTSFTLPAGFTSKLVAGATVENIENGVTLHLAAPGAWGYSIDYSGGQTRLFIKSPPKLSSDPLKPLTGVRVMLDPGHGADDIGAYGIMGTTQGPNEKDCNLAQAQAIAYRLEQLGATVIMGRNDDSFTTTHERLAALIETKPDFFISVHHNATEPDRDRHDAMGAQVYYYMPGNYAAPLSQRFGQNLIDQIAPATGRAHSDAAWGYYNVLRTPTCPAVLFEFGFMMNPTEFESITSADGLYAAACATARGIIASIPQG